MFKELFNFSYQRSAVQAVGFYLFYLLLAVLIGFLGGIVAYTLHLIPTTDMRGALRLGEYIAPIIPIVIGGLVALAKPLTPTTVIVTLLAFAVAFLAGWFGAGLLIAYLTTRPSRLKSA